MAGRLPIAWLDLHNRRRLTIGYVLGMAAYMLVIVALYPAFKNSSELDSLTSGGSTVAALFGVSGTLTSPAGWINANAYTNFLPLIVLLMTIGYGAAAVAGQNEVGTLGLVVSLPTSRPRILAEKVIAMAAQAFVLVATVAACVYVGRAFDVALDPWNVATASLAVLLLGLDLGLLAMALGAATGSRGTAIGIATAVAAVSYLISSLAPVVDWVHSVRFASIFYWAVGDNQTADGAGLVSFAVLLGAGALAAAAARQSLRRLDVR